ncbi:hypothetical protein GGI12_001631 [Dipsacomyces acuminosporus]|nr:hypothetical protein GGI12_001631 [Dipsacomyces acuminosporus]
MPSNAGLQMLAKLQPHISHFEYTPDDDSCEGLDLRIDGHISKPIPEAGRSGADKQYFFVNGRPCDFPKAKKLVNELYRGYNPTKYPVFAIAVEINSKSIDVNLTPDKRTILIRHENQLLAAMRAAMVRALEPSESTFRVNKIQTQLYRENSDLSAQSTATLAEDAAATTLGTTMDKGTSIQPGNTEAVAADGPGLALPNEDSGAAVDMAPVVAETSVPGVLRCSYPKGTGKTDSTGESDSVSKKRQSDQVQDLLQPPPSKQPQLRLPPPPPPPLPLPPQKQQARADIERRIPRPMPKLSDGKENNRPTTKSVKRPDTMVIGACLNRVQNVSRDWSAVRERLRQRQELKAQRLEKSQQREAGLDQDLGAESKIGGGISVTDPEEASAALSRLIHKSDFARMAIIGQFNLGFIITRLENDLYIIDQHASDEKYNFEQLQQRMVISSQPLIRPATLELSVIDEGVAIEYKDILMKNGFHVRVDEDALPGRRVSLLSQPFIDQTLFNQNDLMELIGKLCVNPASMPRCDRARRMFASRACRKSIMIGDPLNAAQMRKVVAHLSGLDHPWMCPHARPTALHLFHLPE